MRVTHHAVQYLYDASGGYEGLTSVKAVQYNDNITVQIVFVVVFSPFLLLDIIGHVLHHHDESRRLSVGKARRVKPRRTQLAMAETVGGAASGGWR